MSSPRLQQQFIRLWQYCDGKSHNTTLSELALLLNCSRRHMRTLLNTMQENGWLSWQAEPGRGKRSRLTFLSTGPALQRERAEDLLEQDRIDQLVQLVGNKDAVRQMIAAHLGRSFRQGKHILRILYYRPLQNLLPGSALRRSETHIVRQLFNGLTRINEENGEAEPDIAHHWQQISALHWRFYLRPGIRFHHGRELDMQDVLSTLGRACTLPLYAHIARIHSPTAWTLDIHLHQPDGWLPWLMGHVSAMVLPQEWPTIADFARKHIGTGPYAVARNSSSQLKIHAFDDYFGYRALIDEVNFWVLPEISDDLSCGVQLDGGRETDEPSMESRLEEGCYYLLFDARSATGASLAARRWIAHILSPVRLIAEAGEQYQRYWFPAWGLIPRWHHAVMHQAVEKPEGLSRIRLTFYREHAEHHILSDIMSALLAKHQVTLEVQEVDYDAWHRGDVVSDLWLNSANFTLPLNFSLFAHLYELPLLQRCIPGAWKEEARQWRAGELPLPEWCKQLLAEGAILPLIHHWLMLQGSRSMRGVRMNTLGWFDFKSAWFSPPES